MSASHHHVQRASPCLTSLLHLHLSLSSHPQQDSQTPPAQGARSQSIPSLSLHSETWESVWPPPSGAPSLSPASEPLTQTGNRDFPRLRALQERQPWGLFLPSTGQSFLRSSLHSSCCCNATPSVRLWAQKGWQYLFGEREGWKGDAAPEAGKATDCDVWAPTPQSFLLVIHPLPHLLVVFTQFFCFPSFLLSQTVGVAGAPGGGFRWLAAFRGFSKPQTLPRPPEF